MNEQYWKQKLMAFLHDPPHKALDIGQHEKEAQHIMRSAGLVDSEMDRYTNKDSDHLSSAIDRFPFPKKVCSAQFTGTDGTTFEKESTFIHPFSGGKYEIRRLQPLSYYSEKLSHAFGGFDGDWKDKFFLYWRFWLENTISQSAEDAGHVALFPADTRIPDHTIWTHMAMTSALEGCRNPDSGKIEPAFLIFQAGPVQEFIAQARSTRDLWSGSYMLAWLVGHAIAAVTDEVGPDAVIFPALRGLGIFDIANKAMFEKLAFSDGKGGSDSLWKRIYNDGSVADKIKSAKRLLNPAMPNRFFAVVPQHKAEALAKNAEKAFKKELKLISHHCWARFAAFAEKLGSPPEDGWKTRWDEQIKRLPELTWQVMPVEQDIEAILAIAAKLPAMQVNEESTSLKTVQALLKLAQDTIPVDERDKRYYADNAKTRLKNWGLTWPLQFAWCEYALAARRNTRNFEAFVTDNEQRAAIKDALSGKEESIGSEEFWEKAKQANSMIKDNEGPYGAVTLMKRFWCKDYNDSKCYLFEKLDISEKIFNHVISAESVPDVAKKNCDPGNPYVAVLALDGDSMGKWMSGANAPKFVEQLAGKAKDYVGNLLEKQQTQDLLRALTPSYHLQFSEALANFANHLAGKIVEHFDGQLIYAGGDDVLAMVPASNALQCAMVLRAVFRGDIDYFAKQDVSNKMELAMQQNGFVQADAGYPLIVPGMNADVSCGIAIAHKNYPLQCMVQEAQRAEKRAKN